MIISPDVLFMKRKKFFLILSVVLILYFLIALICDYRAFNHGDYPQMYLYKQAEWYPALVPVSYTHLDVYKRQVYGGISIVKLTMIQTTASLQIPMGYVYLIVPVTGILIMYFSFTNGMDMLHGDFSEKGEARV